MIVRSSLAAAAAAGLLAFAMQHPARAADTSAKAAADDTKAAATPQVIDADPAKDVAGAWDAFLEKARFDPSYTAYEVLSAVGYGAEGVNADACADQRAALAASVRAVPVSIAIRRAEMLCAEAVGDEAGAERALAALAALSKHALADYGDGALRRPIRVVQPWDIYALLHSLGYEFQYEYHTQVMPIRYFPLTVAAWDPQREVERHLQFDYIDTTVRIDRDSEDAGWPVLRDQNVMAYARGQAQNDDVIGIDVLGVSDAMEADSDGERVALLRKTAERGGVQALAMWVAACSSATPPAGCADGLIDTLLPLAERRQAVPMALLSHAYRLGLGVERDIATADGLLAAADKRWHRGDASVFLAWLMLQQRHGVQAMAYLPQLRKAAEAGNADARYLVALFKQSDEKAGLDAADIAFLEDPANNGTGAGHALLGLYHQSRDDVPAAMRSYARGAAAGNPRSQFLTGAATWMGRDGAKHDPAEGERLLHLAAHGGEVGAMRSLAYLEAEREAWADAVRWLGPAITRGDSDAVLLLADLYVEGDPAEVGGTVEDAVKLYGLLDVHEDRADARRRLASLAIEGRGMKQDLRKARALLEQDAEKGDVESQRTLGMLLISGRLGRADEKNGVRWMERAIAQGDADARAAYGTWLVGRPTASERSRGLGMLEAVLPQDEDNLARNNLAWARCVSPHADVRDPAKGLQVARPMEDNPRTDGGSMDTVAACYAATGDFDKAVALQRRAMDMAKVDVSDEESTMPGRLRLYEARKVFIDAP